MELARRFANRADLLDVYERVRQKCGTGTAEPADTVRTDRPADYNPRERLLSVRLKDDDIAKIVAAGREGMPMQEIADKFKVSRSSIKRILKRHGVGNGRGNYKRE